MDIGQAITNRRSVRSFTSQPIEGEVLDKLQRTIDYCNHQQGLNIQLILQEPQAFAGLLARYGKFSNVQNYLCLVGKKGPSLAEKCGYFGERIVLAAQQLGLDTCWVGVSYSKKLTPAIVRPGEKLLLVIAIGYAAKAGSPRPSKSIEQLSSCSGAMPAWFRSGMEAVQLAPTAINQQKSRFILTGDKLTATAGRGFYTKVDLGIAKYHFEVGAAEGLWLWVGDSCIWTRGCAEQSGGRYH
jgi:nitroreductase